MVRGNRGRATFKRGGGRHFSEFAKDNSGVKKPSNDNGSEEEGSEEEGSETGSEESGSEEESSEELSEEEAGKSTAIAQPELSRTERRDLKKKKQAEKDNKQAEEEEEDPDLINPNHVQQKMNISDLNTPRVLTRREREQKEKGDAKERYWKLHIQGKTDEAKADLNRLERVRAERAAAQAKRIAEAEAKAQMNEARKKGK